MSQICLADWEVEANEDLINRNIEKKVVLITGAGRFCRLRNMSDR